jgi:hypothetical protein
MRFFSDLAGTLRAAFRVGLGMLDASGLTAARTHALPNKSGTIALLDDVSGGEASFDIVPLTATSDGQTTFAVTGGYTLGGIIVILGGSTLAPTHYTATDGANVVLGSGDGVVVGSELVVLRFSTFEVADAVTPATLAAAVADLEGQIDGKMANPMTTAGDLIVGGTAGAPTRLGGGSEGQVLTRVGGTPAWANSAAPNPKQLCTAWVNFNGTGTVAIRDSYNVSSVTDNGTSDYTVNFTEAMSNSNFSAVGTTAPAIINVNGGLICVEQSRSTSGVRFNTVAYDGSKIADVNGLNVQVFGGKA